MTTMPTLVGKASQSPVQSSTAYFYTWASKQTLLRLSFFAQLENMPSRFSLQKCAISLKLKFIYLLSICLVHCPHCLFPSLFSWQFWQTCLNLQKFIAQVNKIFHHLKQKCLSPRLNIGWHPSKDSPNTCNLDVLRSGWDCLFLILFPINRENF